MTHTNFMTGTEYKGGNQATLSNTKFKSTEWATYKQWQEANYQVNKGEHGQRILVVVDDDKDKKKAVRHYTVFNFEQVSVKKEEE